MLTVAHIVLPLTKVGRRRSTVESVTLRDHLLVRLLAKTIAQVSPGGLVIGLSTAQYRKLFGHAVKAVGLPSLFKPCGLRRGGATRHFQVTSNMALTMEMGRWQHIATARTYVNQALLDITTFRHFGNESLHSTAHFCSNMLVTQARLYARKG